tara:strand:+ start:112 stop:348 length:237 start_codon:yes stop_codon:yes gene_type:complete
MSRYELLAEVKPPLDVEIVVRRKNTYVGNNSKVVTLDSKQTSDIDWHVDDLLHYKYLDWCFVDEGEEMAFNLSGEDNE